MTVNNVLLCTAAATVFLGTFYPLIIDMIGGNKISVGPPYYNRTFVPLMVPLLLVMVVGPMLKWKRDHIGDALRRLKYPAVASLIAAIVVLVLTFGRDSLAAAFMALAVWLVVGSLAALAHRTRLGAVPLAATLRFARTTPRAFYGLVIAHAGMGITIAGITGVTSWAGEKIEMLRPGESLELSGYRLYFRSINDSAGPNYDARRAVFDIARGGRFLGQLASEQRFYPVRQQQTTVPGIRTNLISNLYVAIGEPNAAGTWAVRFYYHPLMPWAWIGALTMALGGFVSLSDRRLRVGLPQLARQHVAMIPAGQELTDGRLRIDRLLTERRPP